jgi:intracellular septation protein A
MSPLRRLALKLLPGFLPLVVYVVAEEFWGETIGLATGIACGLVEFAVLLAKERKPDWLAAFDTLLLAGLGGLSLALHDELFFRFKPAVIEAVFAILVGLSAFGSRNLVMGRTLAAMKAGGLDPTAAGDRLRRMLGGLFFLLLLHIAATVLAALWASKEVWLFVSGALLYVLMAVWLAGLFARAFIQRLRRRKTG